MIDERLWKEPPKLHKALYEPGEDRINWGFTEIMFEWMTANVKKNMRTLETGAGLSTIAFAGIDTDHIAIDPTPGLWDRIREHAACLGVDMGRVNFIPERSEAVLPRMANSAKAYAESFDLIILDGSHTFPTPFIDWFYMAQILKVGGILFLDDAWKLPVCRFLMDWMLRAPEWEGIERIGRAHVFRKILAIDHPDRFHHDPAFEVHFKE